VGQALVAIIDSPCIEHPSSKRPGVDSVPRADRCVGRCDRRAQSVPGASSRGRKQPWGEPISSDGTRNPCDCINGVCTAGGENGLAFRK